MSDGGIMRYGEKVNRSDDVFSRRKANGLEAAESLANALRPALIAKERRLIAEVGGRLSSMLRLGSTHDVRTEDPAVYDMACVISAHVRRCVHPEVDDFSAHAQVAVRYSDQISLFEKNVQALFCLEDGGILAIMIEELMHVQALLGNNRSVPDPSSEL